MVVGNSNVDFGGFIFYNIFDLRQNNVINIYGFGGDGVVDTVRLKKLRCAEGYFTAAGFARELGMNEISYRNRENGLIRVRF